MGTRSLTMVVSNGQTKVAQYGQWDGYPEGQGKTVLSFLSRQLNLKQFQQKVDECRFMTQKEFDALTDDSWLKEYPQFSRDHGAEILDLIDKGSRVLINNSDFAADSLFCEWAYVIDFDKNALEVYVGFNKTPLSPDERFYPLADKIKEREDPYYPVKFIKSFPLDALPSEDDFLAAFAAEEESEA